MPFPALRTENHPIRHLACFFFLDFFLICFSFHNGLNRPTTSCIRALETRIVARGSMSLHDHSGLDKQRREREIGVWDHDKRPRCRERSGEVLQPAVLTQPMDSIRWVDWIASLSNKKLKQVPLTLMRKTRIHYRSPRQ